MRLLANLFKLLRDRLRHERPVRRVTCEWCTRPIGCCDCEERINCPRAGTMLHQTCGWCGACEVPMFTCQHLHWESRPERNAT